MKMHKLQGAGLPNVYLNGGVEIRTDSDGDETISYQDMDGLYRAIGRAISRKPGRLSGAELRFLRKRLGWSQRELAALGEKEEQAAAKWEKGTLPVPLAESSLLRLCWLRQNYPNDILHEIGLLPFAALSDGPPLFVFSLVGGQWVQDEALAEQLANGNALAPTEAAINKAMVSAKVEMHTTANGSCHVHAFDVGVAASRRVVT